MWNKEELEKLTHGDIKYAMAKAVVECNLPNIDKILSILENNEDEDVQETAQIAKELLEARREIR